MCLARREEANALEDPAQLQREGPHCDPKLRVQSYSEWGLSTNRSGSSISYKMAEKHKYRLFEELGTKQQLRKLGIIMFDT